MMAMATMISGFLFWMFTLITVVCASMVITARNPVHNVLFLILAFFNSAGLFILVGAEFLAMILVVVYVGAVAVLFLFVVMMLDINVHNTTKIRTRYLPIGLTIASVLLIELSVVIYSWSMIDSESITLLQPLQSDVHNTKALGNVIYTEYFYIFQGAGLLLLVAMIGAITLTLRQRDGVKKQMIQTQNTRNAHEEITLVDVKTGEGLS